METGFLSLTFVTCSDVLLDGLKHTGSVKSLLDSGVRANDS